MIPYRIKHKATGLYYKPGRPNLSKIGKVYITGNNILSYIDDTALGVPLKLDEDGTIPRPYVDWDRTRELLKREGAL